MGRPYTTKEMALSLLLLFLICLTIFNISNQKASPHQVIRAYFLPQKSVPAPAPALSTIEMVKEKSMEKLQFFKYPISDYPTVNWTISGNKTHDEFWRSIEPSFNCPLRLLTRYGKTGDGGKWVCGLENLEKIRGHGEAEPCVVYSFGVNTDSSFEAEVLATTHCAMYAYDMTVKAIAEPLRSSNPRVKFFKSGISAVQKGDTWPLDHYLRANGHEKMFIPILKLDVEGAEYQVLKQILNQYPMRLPFGQILVEFHIIMWQWLDQKTVRERDEFIEIVKLLESRGMRMYSREPNMKWMYGRAGCEFSFINMHMLDFFMDAEDIEPTG